MGIVFYLNSFLLGVGLAMDAFSVSLVNGLNEPDMKLRKSSLIAFTFGAFQAIMPMIGWVCVHTIVQEFNAFEKFIPWIALILLVFIGGKMLIEGIKNKEEEVSVIKKLTFGALMVQAVATSIDALSVGFTIAEYDLIWAIVCNLIIALVTFVISISGVYLGKKIGTKLSNKAQIFGGIILIAIGIEIFLEGILG